MSSASGGPSPSYSAATWSSPAAIAAASSAVRIPHAPSIATCAFDPAMSWRHIRLSNGKEEFIPRTPEPGPSAKRPPHMLLEADVRTVIALLLGPVLLVG